MLLKLLKKGWLWSCSAAKIDIAPAIDGAVIAAKDGWQWCHCSW